jgi:hypothetical protein
MQNLPALLEFVETVNRLGYTDSEIVYELVTFSRLGLGWPKASASHWTQLIESAVADGKLNRDVNGVITIPHDAPIKQLELFA